MGQVGVLLVMVVITSSLIEAAGLLQIYLLQPWMMFMLRMCIKANVKYEDISFNFTRMWSLNKSRFIQTYTKLVLSLC